MTKSRLRELYENARAAAHPNGILACDDADISELAEALDQIIEECGAWEADLVVWAMDNGFPDFETVNTVGDNRVSACGSVQHRAH
jgi:hypothetical protein